MNKLTENQKKWLAALRSGNLKRVPNILIGVINFAV